MENQKKLQRDKQHKVIGGVCSGLADYLGLDATLVRLFFAIAFFFFSTGFWLYLILWIVLPAGENMRNTQSGVDYVVSPDGSAEDYGALRSDAKDPNPNRGSLIAGLILIAIGALGLLNRYVPEFNWHTAWPILLIALGLFLIVPFNSKKS